jgi:hypothetical protein
MRASTLWFAAIRQQLKPYGDHASHERSSQLLNSANALRSCETSASKAGKLCPAAEGNGFPNLPNNAEFSRLQQINKI